MISACRCRATVGFRSVPSAPESPWPWADALPVQERQSVLDQRVAQADEEAVSKWAAAHGLETIKLNASPVAVVVIQT
jgi:hypothetical protein